MNDRIFVIAGNSNEYNIFTRKKCDELYRANNTSISLSNFVYVSDVITLKGYRDPHGYFIGSWRERKDIEDILEQLLIAVHDGNRISKILEKYKKWKQENN